MKDPAQVQHEADMKAFNEKNAPLLEKHEDQMSRLGVVEARLSKFRSELDYIIEEINGYATRKGLTNE